MPDGLDRRLNAYRSDLADSRLSGRVDAERFTEGTAGHIVVPVADLKPVPQREASTDSQLLMGEDVTIFERAAGWCWVQAVDDGYVGYVDDRACSAGPAHATHRVVVPRTFVYPRADLKYPPTMTLSAGSLVSLTGETATRGTPYALMDDGSAVVARHCRPIDEPVGDDFVAIAGDFLSTPYLWGGRSGFGIDCSALIQLSLAFAGQTAPRDSDMQETGLGQAFDPGPDRAGLRRGDFVFWKGHVGMMEDAAVLLHANGESMTVMREPLSRAVDRIARTATGMPTVYRRL